MRLALYHAVPHSQPQSADEGAVAPVALCRSGILGIGALCPESGDEPPLSFSFPHLKPMRYHHSLNMLCHSLAACRMLPSKKPEIDLYNLICKAEGISDHMRTAR
jgi:hypothetical protein